jgi:hypothetical protein
MSKSILIADSATVDLKPEPISATGFTTASRKPQPRTGAEP